MGSDFGLTRWEPESGTFKSVGFTYEGTVHALALNVASWTLYVGGDFANSGLFSWDGSEWSYLGLEMVNRLALDSASGALYVVDGDGALFKWDEDVSALSSIEGAGFAIDLLVVDAARSALHVGGTDLATWDTELAEWSYLADGLSAGSLALDPSSGALYVSDFRGWDSSSSMLRRWADGSWSSEVSYSAYAIAFDSARGALLATGQGMYTWDGSAALQTEFGGPSGGGPPGIALAVHAPACAAGNVPTTSGGACNACSPGLYVKDCGSNRR